jgi:hypothetical protein
MWEMDEFSNEFRMDRHGRIVHDDPCGYCSTSAPSLDIASEPRRQTLASCASAVFFLVGATILASAAYVVI